MAQDDDTEVWAVIPGHPYYAASTLGRIRRERAGINTTPGRVLKASPNITTGYLHVSLSEDGIVSDHNVHTLVAITFLGSCPAGCEVNHKNTVKADCRLSNLEYLTRSKNAQHAIAAGRWRPPKGETHPYAKLTDAKVRKIRQLLVRGTSARQIAMRLGVSHGTIGRIKLGKGWKHLTRVTDK